MFYYHDATKLPVATLMVHGAHHAMAWKVVSRCKCAGVEHPSVVQKAGAEEERAGVPEEAQVASRLAKDFGRFGPAEDSPGVAYFSIEESGHGVQVSSEDEADLRDVYNHTFVNHASTSAGAENRATDVRPL